MSQEPNYLVKCIRRKCSLVHAESTRKWVPDGFDATSKTSVCPDCGCDSVYHLHRGKRGGMVPSNFKHRDEWLTAPAESEVSP